MKYLVSYFYITTKTCPGAETQHYGFGNTIVAPDHILDIEEELAGLQSAIEKERGHEKVVILTICPIGRE